MASIVLKNKGQVIQTLILDKGSAILGRSDEADLTVPDVNVSRNHAKISKVDDGSFVIEDLGSHNGTVLNGMQISEASPLGDNDQISLGSYTIQFSMSDTPKTQSSTAAPASQVTTTDVTGRGVNTFDGDADGQLGDMLRGMLANAKKEETADNNLHNEKPAQAIGGATKSTAKESGNEDDPTQGLKKSKNLPLIIGLVIAAIIIIVLAIFLPSILG